MPCHLPNCPKCATEERVVADAAARRCRVKCPTCGRGCMHDVPTHTTILGGGRRDDRHVCWNDHRWAS